MIANAIAANSGDRTTRASADPMTSAARRADPSEDTVPGGRNRGSAQGAKNHEGLGSRHADGAAPHLGPRAERLGRAWMRSRPHLAFVPAERLDLVLERLG